jgi:hypothetical protein
MDGDWWWFILLAFGVAQTTEVRLHFLDSSFSIDAGLNRYLDGN